MAAKRQRAPFSPFSQPQDENLSFHNMSGRTSPNSLGNPLLYSDQEELLDMEFSNSQSTCSSILKLYPILTLLPSIAILATIWFLPPPSDLSSESMHLLAVFAGVMVGLFCSNYPLSLLVGSGIVLLSLSKSFYCLDTKSGKVVPCRQCESSSGASCDTFGAALQGFASPVVWLVFSAFQIGRAVEKTRLGYRIALYVLNYGATSFLALGYGVFFVELILGPFIPSNTARGGGIVLPIVNSLIETLRTHPTVHSDRIGQYLTLCGIHANILMSSVFLSGMASNPLIQLEVRQHFGIHWDYMQWLKGSMVPGAMVAAILPLLFNKLFPCEVNTQYLKDEVGGRLRALGSLSKSERSLMVILVSMVVLWITSGYTHLDSALVAFTGMLCCVYLHVLSWDDLIGNRVAWDTFFWLGGLVMLSKQMTLQGLMHLLGSQVGSLFQNASPLGAAFGLTLVYFYLMYLFSSLSAHMIALAGPFFAAGKALGCHPMLLIPLISYSSSLCGCLTHYSTGSVALYAANGHLEPQKLLYVGLLVSFIHLSVYFSVGSWWWGILGWW